MSRMTLTSNNTNNMKLRGGNLFLSYICLLVLFAFRYDSQNRKGVVSAFVSMMPSSIDLLNNNKKNKRIIRSTVTRLSSTKKPLRPSNLSDTDIAVDDEEDTPLNPVGAKFFGGSIEKEELFDPDIEKKSSSTTVYLGYDRFNDTDAFPEGKDGLATCLAQRLQGAINSVLLQSEKFEGNTNTYNDRKATSNIYSPNLTWSSPFFSSANNNNPLQELACARTYYRQIDVSILSAKTTASKDGVVELRWVVSLKWPNLWEAQVVLTGTSLVTVSDPTTPLILKQEDYLDNGGTQGKDLIKSLAWQLLPRFWDIYHVGMTPSAEVLTRLQPKVSTNSFFRNYELYEIPPRLVIQASILDATDRERRVAQLLPNHLFSCTIITIGKEKERYIPTTPVEVRIVPLKDGEGSSSKTKGIKKREIIWKIPVPAFLSSAFSLPVPVDMDRTNNDSNIINADKYYTVEGRRRVATCKYSGYVQDEQVVDVRKRLYEAVVRDGLRPKLDKSSGKPIFFILQNKIKCCFTKNGGLGMAVYESRPKMFSADEVGIELEI
jgi:hypothetical protein